MAAPSKQISVVPMIVSTQSLRDDEYMANEGCSSENAYNYATVSGTGPWNSDEILVKEEPLDIEMNETENEFGETSASLTPTLLKQLRAPALCPFSVTTDEPHPVTMIKAADYRCSDPTDGMSKPSLVSVKNTGRSPETKISPGSAKTQKKRGRPPKKKATGKKRKPFQTAGKSKPQVQVSGLVPKHVQKQHNLLKEKETLWTQCVVCCESCPMVKNRKLPNLPFCKRCKKAYFFQTNHSRQKPRICSRMGRCKIQHAVGTLCSPCHFKKMDEIVKRGQAVEDKLPPENKFNSLQGKQYELLKRLGFCSQRSFPRQKMGVSATGDELIQLERQALSTVPYVKLERLQFDDEGNPVISPKISDGLLKVKQEPLEINWFQNANISNVCGQEHKDEEQTLPLEIRMPAVSPKLPRVRSERRRNQEHTGRKGQTSPRKSRSAQILGSPNWILPQGIKVFLFTCGHVCSKCNKGVDKKWLNDKGFKTIAPCTNQITKRSQHKLMDKFKAQTERAQKTLPRPEYWATLTLPVHSQVLASQHSSTPKGVSTLAQPVSTWRQGAYGNPVSSPQIPFSGLAQVPQIQNPLISTASVLNQISQAGGLSKQFSLPPQERLSQSQLPLLSPAVVTPNVSINSNLQVFFANQIQSSNVTVGPVSSAVSSALKPQGTSSHTDSTHSHLQINEETRKVLLQTLRHKNPSISSPTAGGAGAGIVVPCSPDLGSTQPKAQTLLGLSSPPGPQTPLNQAAPSDEHTPLTQPCETVNSSDVSDSVLMQTLRQVLDANPNAKLILSNVPRK